MDRFDEMRAKKAKPKLQVKTATPTKNNVAITPDTGYDGLSKVTVEGDSNLVSSNIKKNVSIFGVTGTLESGGGSSNFNVYMQNNEPSSKNGVWIKGNKSSAGVKFFDYATATGEFMEATKFDFLKQGQGEVIVGQEIIDGYFYFIVANGNSRKMDLKSKTVSSITTPNYIANLGNYYYWCGSCTYNNKIYIFAANSYSFYWYYYDVDNDVGSLLYKTGYNNNLETTPRQR